MKRFFYGILLLFCMLAVCAEKTESWKIAYGELTVGEIADRLHYSSAAHLSAQFKAMTGLSPTRFRRLREPRLKPLDEI